MIASVVVGRRPSQRILGADHIDTLTSRDNLAYAYRAAGRLDEAIAVFDTPSPTASRCRRRARAPGA